LEEEYAMQASWREDKDKLTFIINTAPPPEGGGMLSRVFPGQHDVPGRMVGDVNLFLYPAEQKKKVVGELEIMIASPSARGRGLAKEALRYFLRYISTRLPDILSEYGDRVTSLQYLRVKIDKDNTKSIKLFEGLGFSRVSEEANYFGEVEMRLEEGGNGYGVEGLRLRHLVYDNFPA
jgi:RimJ/RimL family protein N-acetyltransferase